MENLDMQVGARWKARRKEKIALTYKKSRGY